MKKNTLNILFILIFIGFLLLPNVIMFTDLESNLKDNEKRTIKSLELEGNTIQKIGALKVFYKNNFGLKKTLTSKYIDLKNNTLYEDPIPYKTIKGKNGWFFLGDDFNGVFSGSIGLKQYTEEEQRIIIEQLVIMQEWLNKNEIAFYIAVPPNKHTIYKEQLPVFFKEKTKYNALLEQIKQTTTINIIDLAPALMEAKKTNQIYHKTDSHWNDLGAYIAYKELINSLKNEFPTVKSVPLDLFEKEELVEQHKEMTRMINLEIDEKIIRYHPTIETKATIIKNTENYSHFSFPKNDLKIYLLRDSFSNAWMKYINASFRESIFTKSHSINKNDILTQKPDIVILEIVERNFDRLIKLKKPIQ